MPISEASGGIQSNSQLVSSILKNFPYPLTDTEYRKFSKMVQSEAGVAWKGKNDVDYKMSVVPKNTDLGIVKGGVAAAARADTTAFLGDGFEEGQSRATTKQTALHMKENNTAKRKTMELGEIDLSSYCQFLMKEGENKPIVACYCAGIIISSLNKMNGGFGCFQTNCFEAALKEGDEISVPFRILHFLSWQEAVSMEGWNAERSASPGGKPFARKMEDKASEDGKYALDFSQVISLDTKSPAWAYLHSVHGPKLFWLGRESPTPPTDEKFADGVVQMWRQGVELVGGRIGLLVSAQRVGGGDKIVAVQTNFKAFFSVLPECSPTVEELTTRYSLDEHGRQLEFDDGDARKYYDDANTGYGIEQMEVNQTMQMTIKTNKKQFANLYALIGCMGVNCGPNPVIPFGTFLLPWQTDFWRDLSAQSRETMLTQIARRRIFFECQMRRGLFGPTDLLHETQLQNHRKSDDPSAWIWCYLVLHGGPWTVVHWAGTQPNSASRFRKATERFAFLSEHCNYDKTKDEYNESSDFDQLFNHNDISMW
ncbi:hypothetical protein ScalyP_jg705 [Parmales sp. scaly parma]|nr:hypothetical protein ScalyP_jg705 [Parmales sp. scaly parma]